MKDRVILEEDVKIRYSEMDCNLVLKPSALLQYLQDLASDNAESMEFGYSCIIKKNLAWFLLKYRFEFVDYPQNIFNLHIKTEPRGYNKLFALRDFEIGYNGKILGRAATTWALVDINSKTMVNVAEALAGNRYLCQLQKRDNDLHYDKIKPIINIDIEKVFDIKFDDLDVNRHVNNSNYIVWAFETLDFNFRTKYKLKTLDIVFKKEIKHGAKVKVLTEISKYITNHVLKNNETNEDLCLIKAEWTQL